jgi:hypothetical protein
MGIFKANSNCFVQDTIARAVVFAALLLTTNASNVCASEFDGVTGNPPRIDALPENQKSAFSENVVQLFAPNANMTTINFDDALHNDCVNTRYSSLGIEFKRDDSYCVHAYNWTGRNTTSPPMILATTSGPGAPTYVSHVNLIFSKGTYKVGAYIGNDQISNMSWTLEVFDINDQSIGSVSLVSNGNTSVDEFLGLTSPTKIMRARFSNNTISYSVGLDDVSFDPSLAICDIQLNKTSFVNSDQVTAQVLRIANTETAPLPIELKLWLEAPGIAPISVVNVGADGFLVFPAEFDLNLGPVALFTVSAQLPRGEYSFNCRLLVPTTGGPLAEDINWFDIQ